MDILDLLKSITVSDDGFDLNLTDSQSTYLQDHLLGFIETLAAKNPNMEATIVNKVLVPASLKYAKKYIVGGLLVSFAGGYCLSKFWGK